MQIRVNTDSSVDGSETLAAEIESMIESALGRFSDRLTRVEAHLTDEGNKGDHSEDAHCVLEARPAGHQPLVVTGIADTVEHACHDATRRMQRLLESTFGRIDDRHADETIRGPGH